MAKKKKAEKTVKAEKKKEKCIIQGCDNDRFVRGLCNACYYSANSGMNDGSLNEKELLEQGLILPARRGRKSTSAFARTVKKSGKTVTKKTVEKKAAKKKKASKKKK